MWQDDAVVENDLRQGDLLVDLLLPTLELPLPFIRTGSEIPVSGAQAVVKAKTRRFVVVSQCCTIENGLQIALAPLRSTARLKDGEELAYTWESPDDVPAESAVGFAFSAMALEPVPGTIESSSDGRLTVVDFNDTLSYGGSRDELVAARVARMTPEGRKRLRVRLMYFWGRPEAEDEAALAAAGASPY